jgi:hypothetical protein
MSPTPKPTHSIPPVSALKAEARDLRTLSAGSMSNSKSLETLAHRYGLSDWNTLRACARPEQAPAPRLGQRVEAVYLGHPVTGVIHAVRTMGAAGAHRVAIDLDKPVNVSAFEGMDVLRRRLQATIGPDGTTVEKTSDGRPQLQVLL